jgi:hypothetical protein
VTVATEDLRAHSAQTTTGPEATARAYVDTWNDREYAAIPGLASEGVVMYDPAAPTGGVAGPKGEIHGRDGLRQFIEVLTTAFPDFEITVLDVVGDAETVTFDVRSTMTHEGPLGGFPPTGRRLRVRGASVLCLEAGLVRQHTFYEHGRDGRTARADLSTGARSAPEAPGREGTLVPLSVIRRGRHVTYATGRTGTAMVTGDYRHTYGDRRARGAHPTLAGARRTASGTTGPA